MCLATSRGVPDDYCRRPGLCPDPQSSPVKFGDVQFGDHVPRACCVDLHEGKPAGRAGARPSYDVDGDHSGHLSEWAVQIVWSRFGRQVSDVESRSHRQSPKMALSVGTFENLAGKRGVGSGKPTTFQEGTRGSNTGVRRESASSTLRFGWYKVKLKAPFDSRITRDKTPKRLPIWSRLPRWRLLDRKRCLQFDAAESSCGFSIQSSIAKGRPVFLIPATCVL